MKLRERVGPTGLTMWASSTDDTMSIVWSGPGSGLMLGLNATKVDGILVRIEHRSANGIYDTRREARAAAHAFALAAS